MLICYERETAIICSVLLIAINLANLYFIIDLLTYDEIVGYLTDGNIKRSNPHGVAYMLVTVLLNLLFVVAALLSRLTKDY